MLVVPHNDVEDAVINGVTLLTTSTSTVSLDEHPEVFVSVATKDVVVVRGPNVAVALFAVNPAGIEVQEIAPAKLEVNVVTPAFNLHTLFDA